MFISAPTLDLNLQVREAFDEACSAIFETHAQRPLGRKSNDLLLGFARHYRRLTALPRRTRRSMERRWKCALASIALLLTLSQAPASAEVIEVFPGTPPSINADGRCSLIEAIVNANKDARTHLDCVAGSGLDTIRLPELSQQSLKTQEIIPKIWSRIVIDGRNSTIRRNTSTPSYLNILDITAAGDVTLNKVTVAGATAGFVSGYGVSNAGHLTLNDSAISGTAGLLNSGGIAVLRNSRVTGTVPVYDQAGGAIKNIDGGTLVVTNSVISGNEAWLRGGGIDNAEGSTVTLTDSAVSNNRIHYEGVGGGIFNRGSLVLVGTTVAGNTAYDAGGISNGGTATVRRSTISGNHVTGGRFYGFGGGIRNGGKLTLANSTVSNNWGNVAQGGGVLSRGALTILDSTITGNSAEEYNQEGGGVFVGSGTLTLQRSIVSGNRAGTGREIDVAAGVVVSADDHNLFGHAGDAGVAGFAPSSTDIVPNEPIGGILLPLADNGGGTQTHALAIGSPALDASPDDATCPTIDQRGNPRPRGPACDIGAFEGVAVLCNGKVTTMVGTINDDHLTGTAGPDVISGLIGDDTILGLEGNDLICAGSGADVVYGGPGADLLFGEPGDDRLFGQGGNDSLSGGVGQDRCDGGSGAGDTATTCENVTGVP
jgi:hypothetical protein